MARASVSQTLAWNACQPWLRVPYLLQPLTLICQLYGLELALGGLVAAVPVGVPDLWRTNEGATNGQLTPGLPLPLLGPASASDHRLQPDRGISGASGVSRAMIGATPWLRAAGQLHAP